jgi:hypothetical protein
VLGEELLAVPGEPLPFESELELPCELLLCEFLFVSDPLVVAPEAPEEEAADPLGW